MNCPVHGEWPTTLYRLKQGHGCSKCADERSADARRLTFEEVQAVLEEFCERTAKGYSVLECNYINNTSEIRMNCPVHGEWPTTLSVLKKGHGCPTCGDERIGDAHRLSTEEVQAVLDNFCISTAKGYTVLECNFIDVRTKNIMINCPIHGPWPTTLNSIKKGCGCPECGYNSRADACRLSIDHVYYVLKEFCERTAKGYTVLECNYTGINDRNIRMNCPVHGEWKTTMKIIQQGGSCKKCSYVQRTADMRARIEK